MHQTFRQGTIKDQQELKELVLISYGQFEKVLTKDNSRPYLEKSIGCINWH